MILFVSAKGERSEAGFRCDSYQSCFERYRKHVEHWNKVQAERNEKPYTFTGYIEDDEGNRLISPLEFKIRLGRLEEKQHVC